MAPAQKKSKSAAIAALIAALIIVIVVLGYALTRWSTIEKTRKLKNPVPATPTALAEGKQIYQQHCQRCHGPKGDGHGEKAPSLSVAPGDFTDATKMRRQADGELYWQITYGRLPMPAFKDKVDENGRWELVDYIRTFAVTRSHVKPAAVSKNSAPSTK